MKKINLSFGFFFLLLAVFFTIDIVMHNIRGDSLRLTSYVPTVFMYCLAGIYLYLGCTAEKKQNNRMANLTAFYNDLLNTYEDILDSNNSKDMLSRKAFYSGVKDFGGIVFDILTSSFPQNMKDHAEEMLNDLLEKVSKLEQT